MSMRFLLGGGRAVLKLNDCGDYGTFFKYIDEHWLVHLK